MGERFFFQICMNSAHPIINCRALRFPERSGEVPEIFGAQNLRRRHDGQSRLAQCSALPIRMTAPQKDLCKPLKKVWTGAGARLLITAGSGCAGRGDLSTAAAQGFAHAAASGWALPNRISYLRRQAPSLCISLWEKSSVGLSEQCPRKKRSPQRAQVLIPFLSRFV